MDALTQDADGAFEGIREARGMSATDGANAVIFREMTLQTIVRKLDRLDTEDLIDLLGHLIIRERKDRLTGLRSDVSEGDT